jgi:hypothetical protein
MLFQPKYEKHPARLADRLQHAETVTPAIISDVVETCTRIAALDRIQARTRIARLIASEAWTDAALALVELELPQWKLRRLLYEGGEWHCCLSRQPELPVWTDETVEIHHESLPLAILCAFIDAREIAATPRDTSRTVPLVPPEQCQAVCCDNFA